MKVLVAEDDDFKNLDVIVKEKERSVIRQIS